MTDKPAGASPGFSEGLGPLARMHDDGRVVTEQTYAQAAEAGGALWSAVKDYTIRLYPQAAIDAAVAAERERIISALPGGHSVDPQWVADMVRWPERA